MVTCFQSSNSGWGQICQQEVPSPAEWGWENSEWIIRVLSGHKIYLF